MKKYLWFWKNWPGFMLSSHVVICGPFLIALAGALFSDTPWPVVIGLAVYIIVGPLAIRIGLVMDKGRMKK